MASFAYGENRTGSTSNSSKNVWDKQSPYLTDIYGKAQALSERTPEESVAGFTPMQSQGFGLASQYATGGGQDIYNQSANALNFGLNAADVNQNPYLQQAMNAAIRPITQNYQENVMPGIGGEAIGAGQYGSSRQGIAEGIASRDYLNTIGDVTANMGSQAYGQGLNAMMGSLAQAPTVQNMGLFGANTLQNVGAQQQGMNQAMMNSPWSNLAQYQQAVGAPTVLGGSTSQSKGKAWNVSGSFGDS